MPENQFFLPTAADKKIITETIAKVQNIRGAGVSNSGTGLSISPPGDAAGSATANPRPYLVGAIVSNGPSGEPDFSDNTYWVEVVYLKYLTADTYDTAEFPGGDIRGQIVRATNLAEYDGSHVLPTDGSVQVTVDNGYDSHSVQRYFFALVPPLRVTGCSSDSSSSSSSSGSGGGVDRAVTWLDAGLGLTLKTYADDPGKVTVSLNLKGDGTYTTVQQDYGAGDCDPVKVNFNGIDLWHDTCDSSCSSSEVHDGLTKGVKYAYDCDVGSVLWDVGGDANKRTVAGRVWTLDATGTNAGGFPVSLDGVVKLQFNTDDFDIYQVGGTSGGCDGRTLGIDWSGISVVSDDCAIDAQYKKIKFSGLNVAAGAGGVIVKNDITGTYDGTATGGATQVSNNSATGHCGGKIVDWTGLVTKQNGTEVKPSTGNSFNVKRLNFTNATLAADGTISDQINVTCNQQISSCQLTDFDCVTPVQYSHTLHGGLYTKRLSDGKYVPVLANEVDVVTSVVWDSTNHKLIYKYRTLYMPALEASGTTNIDIVTFDPACP